MSHPDRIWLHRYAYMKSEGAILAAAKGIAPLVMETFDGCRYGSVEWDKLSPSDQAILLIVAKRALWAADGYACGRASCDSGSDRHGGDASAAPGEASQSGGAEGDASPTPQIHNPEHPHG